MNFYHAKNSLKIEIPFFKFLFREIFCFQRTIRIRNALVELSSWPFSERGKFEIAIAKKSKGKKCN